MSAVEMEVQESAEAGSERAQRALQSSPVLAIRGVRVEQVGNRLIIQGRVLTFYHKQQAQEAVRTVVGRLQVVNNVEVLSLPPR